MTKCETGCGKTAYFNSIGQKKGRFCSAHKNEGMVNVLDKCCDENGCIGNRATFGLPNGKPKYCMTHTKEGMLNLTLKRCKGIDGVKCYTSPIYNFPNEKKGIYCIQHKLDGMVNVTGKRCENKECNFIAQFNFESEITGRFCSTHKLDGMIDIKHNRCEFNGCNVSPSYKYDSDTHCRFCSIHKLDGMIDGKHKKCHEKGCMISPSYNYEGEDKPKYCVEHKLDDMIDIKHNKCENIGCNLRPIYNYSNSKKGRFCFTHKLENMEDVMNKKCLSEWCNTQAKINKYEGYCLFCFVNLFPDKPVTRNYKTKERTVVDFVLNHFPQFTWISDKKVQDGCSKRRPDLLLDLGFQVVIIEVDENQHITYDCSCENKRLMEISKDIGHRPLVFIRFNPDSYVTIKNELIKSCWRSNQLGIFIINKDENNDWNNRLETLKTQIEYWSNNPTDKTLEVVHLFYDNFH